MTVWLLARNTSIRPAAVPWGRARKTASVSAGTWSNTSSPVVARPGWMPAIGAPWRSRPTRPVIATFGWRARSRISSPPTYPVAPTIATRTGSPSSARAPRSAADGAAWVGVDARSAAIAAPLESALTGARGRSPAAGSRVRRSGGTWSRAGLYKLMHNHATAAPHGLGARGDLGELRGL